MKYAYLDGNQVTVNGDQDSNGNVKKEKIFFTREDYEEYLAKQYNNQKENDK
ncbi:hypothetical protein [Sporomusa acidovorans]|uniref:Uncharacterized protein n=1 Tax=Sporomusa acidovorans (strain ATCC 49682 / DSM 3132 / Mol) TaxID=1123286 RepID=A0ABZ3J4W9_SPOA4|nr:hypothetical protein [Sporomusa acidovorans]OZC20936.1 hypothetical protein SPACI_23000 [Sporomusa acidovorans DSM 3132]SDE61481.1 hypothetical protein SAMN04488499_101790 [Sporomusa acidovorans]